MVQWIIFRRSILMGILLTVVYSSHFRGGGITWRPLDNVPSGRTVQIQIRQRYSWRRSFFSPPCTDTTIANGGTTGANWTLRCYTGACSTSGWNQGVSTIVYCTDFDIQGDLSSGERYDTFTLALNTSISIGYVQSAWLANLVVGAHTYWYMINRVSTILRPDGLINSSPMVRTLPVIYKAVNISHVHVIQMSDIDAGDILKCRWSIRSKSNINSFNECGGVCSGIPGATLSPNNCTLTFILKQVNRFYAVALQIEDYYSSSSTTPMSSVPIQFLFYSYKTPSSCNIPPAIISPHSNRTCIGTAIGSNVTEYVVAQVFCTGKSITDFVTSSPIGMRKSGITMVGSNLYQIVVSWIPTSSQYGPQGFCVGAVDNTVVQSAQWCVTFLVGIESPNLIPTTMVQGTISPIGTVFANQTIFSVQATHEVTRPTRNGTYIYFTDAKTRTIVHSIDCGWDPNVVYTGKTMVFRVLSPSWIPGHSYYITFDSDVASSTKFCRPESPPVTDPSFWVFNIWNSAFSSSATTTTSPGTVRTITTRDISTSTVNTMLTTTGIFLTSVSTNHQILISTTTTTESSTLSGTITSILTLTTTTTSLSITTVLPLIDVSHPTDMNESCKLPIILMSIITMVIMSVVHALGMYVGFIKLMDAFEPRRVNVIERHVKRTNKIHCAWDSIYSIRTDMKRSKKPARKVRFTE